MICYTDRLHPLSEYAYNFAIVMQIKFYEYLNTKCDKKPKHQSTFFPFHGRSLAFIFIFVRFLNIIKVHIKRSSLQIQIYTGIN